MVAVNSRMFGATFSSAAMPSGATTTQIAVMSTALRDCSSPMVCAIDPPVASIGSSTNTGWVLRSSGSDSRYGVG